MQHAALSCLPVHMLNTVCMAQPADPMAQVSVGGPAAARMAVVALHNAVPAHVMLPCFVLFRNFKARMFWLDLDWLLRPVSAFFCS